MKKLLLGLAIIIVVLAVIVGTRTAMYQPEPQPEKGAWSAVVEPLPGYADRFAGALRFRTVSHQDPAALDTAQYSAFRAYLAESFPAVHRSLERVVVNQHSLLYTWRGTDVSLGPVVLMGHYDVVGVAPETLSEWDHPPFAGDVVDGWVWGRGAVDNKVNVIGALEAVESLLGEGFTPRRTVILAFGHDEEVGGSAGAAKLVARLDSLGVEPWLVLDEGGFIGEDLFDGVGRPVALVGVTEKGYAEVRLTVSAEGGHGSAPPPQTAAGVVAAAVAALEADKMPTRLTPVVREMFHRVGREMPLGQRIPMANLWLFEPVFLSMLESSPATNALVRTTTAATMLEGSIKANVLPTRARAVLNFRILPGDSLEGVMEHIHRVVDDERVEIEVLGFHSEPPPPAPSDGPTFEALETRVREINTDALVTPFLVVGATDARHFTALTDRVYRFMPVRITRDLLSTLHGTNERIRLEDFRRAVDFYGRLMRGE
ncbi:MAG: M20 family peptidase [Candidatus Longimicrobiales bacterium M2_2A_002]